MYPFLPEICTLSENTSLYCSRIIVVHVHATVFFSKLQPACHNIEKGIKPGSNSKKTDMLKSCKLGRNVIYV